MLFLSALTATISSTLAANQTSSEIKKTGSPGLSRNWKSNGRGFGHIQLIVIGLHALYQPLTTLARVHQTFRYTQTERCGLLL